MTAENISRRYRQASDVLQDLRPLQLVGKTISNKYQIVKYLGGRPETQSYVDSKPRAR